MKVLLLSRSDVEGIVSMREVMDVVEEAFRAKGLGRVQMPPKTYIFFQRFNGDFRVMPAYIEDLNAAGVKVVNVHPENPVKRRMPTVMALIELLDPESGKPIAIMDGTWITNMRTGAAGGIAAKYLARRNSRVVGLVGAGVQARTQLLALKEVFKIDEVRIYSRTSKTREKFVKDMDFLGLSMKPVEEVKDAVLGCDIVVTTTPAKKPVVKSEWVSSGVHINGIGADAPGKEEIDPEILKRAKIVVDDYEQAFHSGEVNVPLSKGIISEEDVYGELSEIIVGKKRGRESDEEITLFDSTGLAIQDISTAWLVYEKALEKGVGREVDLL